ncbi:MAG: pantothenate kinase [Bacteroidetes bacterium MED-G21]|nr:MAG: pantothenate kinase [Bacteroidetes bacterium MED-G21]
MSLVIDIGNTRTKYAYFVGGRIKEKGNRTLEDVPKIVSHYSGKAKNVMLSSVKTIPDNILSESIKHKPNLVVLSSEMEMPFKIVYETPKTLGSDRLSLVAGAAFVFPNRPVLIIDVGTCITIDFIDRKTRYLGGSISPGLKMRLKALGSQTDALPLVELSEPKDLIGSSTKESILSGVVNGAIKELEGAIDSYQKRYSDTIVVLTGGDLGFFDKKLKNSIFADKDILLKGMYFILKQHANK